MPECGLVINQQPRSTLVADTEYRSTNTNTTKKTDFTTLGHDNVIR